MIEVLDVQFRYSPDAAPALTGVSLSVQAGEMVGIVGPNGSGKSTLGRLMKGLVMPTDGRVLVDSLDTGADGLAVRGLVGLVFQNPNSQIVNTVVENEVAFGPENAALATSEIRKRVSNALQAVGMNGQENAECHALTMAGKQRVAIASVLAMEPKYVVLDEPTTWLEPKARWGLLREVMRWASAAGAGLVLITHRMDEAQLCDRLYGMLHGEMVVSGSPDDLLRDEDIRTRLSLEIPESYMLTSELHDAGLPVEPGFALEWVAEAICPS
ncbi:MAG: ATP-binding cassette domain-containing protein [Chloroflexota bacterium]